MRYNIKIKSNYKLIFINLLLVFILVCLCVNPEVYMTSIYNGVILWGKAVLPALFPFFFLSKILTELGSVRYLSLCFEKITQKLFKVNGVASYAFLMSIFSGYPVGAKITSELYENNFISKNDMYKMCAFCSTSGPLFIIGTIGVGMLANKTAGLIILLCHILGAIANGVLWRGYRGQATSFQVKHEVEKTRKVQDDLLNYSITNSVISVLVVGGFIALFCMFVDVGINTGLLGIIAQFIAVPLNLLGIDSAYALPFVTGLIEITRGSLEISKIALSPEFMTILITILVSFGGLSTHLQSLAFLGKHKLKYGFFLAVKTTQAIISGLLAFIFVSICY